VVHQVQELGSFIREQRERSALSLRKLAARAGISNPYLSQIERGLRRPSADILKSLAKALSISAETLYERAGLLDRPPGRDVAAAIHADPALTPGQKQALTEIYRSFVRGTGKEHT
jgi:transcriptional regulator with XRE-family HTH domain